MARDQMCLLFCNTTSLFKVVLYVDPKQWFHIEGKDRQEQNIEYAWHRKVDLAFVIPIDLETILAIKLTCSFQFKFSPHKHLEI